VSSVVFAIGFSPRRGVITSRDGRVCDTLQRTAIATADSEVHDEPVFDSRDEVCNTRTSFAHASLRRTVSARQGYRFQQRASLNASGGHHGDER
jgi:hypothetical protein